jgi:amino acid transporter
MGRQRVWCTEDHHTYFVSPIDHARRLRRPLIASILTDYENSISITGFVILGGNVSRIPDPGVNFKNSFEGTTDNGNDLANALVNIVFSYTGYANAFNVVNEIHNPIRTIRRSGLTSILVVAILYMLCNIAYFSAG